jgi:hypothetical protein
VKLSDELFVKPDYDWFYKGCYLNEENIVSHIVYLWDGNKLIRQTRADVERFNINHQFLGKPIQKGNTYVTLNIQNIPLQRQSELIFYKNIDNLFKKKST